MALEIERKFLVSGDAWRDEVVSSHRYEQGYLTEDRAVSARVRLAEDAAWLGIKAGGVRVARAEYEYPIPVADARAMLDTLCAGRCLRKVRHIIPAGDGLRWEVDEFEGENAGLVVAEIELAEEGQRFQRPAWLGAEVSLDHRYYNVNLVAEPYRRWKDQA